MSQYPANPHVRNDGELHVTPSGSLFCRAAGCRAHQDVMVQDESEPITPRWAIAGSDLCTWHAAQLGRVLVDLVELHGMVEKALIRRSSSGADDPRVRTSGVRDVGDFWNPTAARVLADLHDWARDVARVVLEDRPVPAAETTVYDHVRTRFQVDGSKRTTVTQTQVLEHRTFTLGISLDDAPRLQLATLARHHAHWLALYPGLGASILSEALAHRRHALKAVDAQAFRRVALPNARCSVVVEHEEFGDVYCHGQLVGIVQDPGASRRPSAVVCSNDPAHVIPRTEWMHHAS